MTESPDQSFDIYVHKNGLMHNMLVQISKGYVYYFSGTISPQKLHSLRSKLSETYHFDLSKFQKARRKKSGKFNATFFAYPKHGSTDFEWYVLLTEDVSLIGYNEKVFDTRNKKQRIIVSERFEAILLPQSGSKPAWTWRIVPSYFLELKQQISDNIRVNKSLDDFYFILKNIHKFPGFRGIRSQIYQLRKHSVGELNRIKKSVDVDKIMNRYIRYARFQKYPTINSKFVIDRIAEGKSPFKDDWKYPEAQTRLVSLEKK
ncbi:hypothetical protein WH95_19500 [Kiloniella litopenaei]|uniref:Uncharacterized protein n=1 Tax=Kiloniella litopenaei TaxID=1549748 RepID=A0A0M2R6R4_9PROT|nr:hypothetical protein [Kiloniella litopenaei]KKJ75208.1 hypothetical protein WH95_19500 [Kiloniella litopenaei]